MRSLYFIVDTVSGVILTQAYQTKSGLLNDYNVDPGEEIVELNSEDMLTEEQVESFETLWEDRVQK